MEEKPDPARYPYSAPPQTWSEHAAVLLKRYGPSVAFGLMFLAILGGVLWSVPQARFSSLEAVKATFQPGSAQRTPPPSSAYAGEAKLSVISQPAGALVLVDEDTLGHTPQGRRTVPAGAHLVSLRMEGYAALDSVIILRNDRPTTLRARLKRPGAAYPEPAYEADDWKVAGDSLSRPEAQPSDSSSRLPSAADAASQPQPQQPASRPTPPARASSAQQADPPPSSAPQSAPQSAPASRSASRYEKALRQGNEFFVEERYEEALDAYGEALDAKPGDERASERLQKTRQRIEEEQRRAQQYQYHRARGDVLFEQQRYREAATDYEKALQDRPRDAYAAEHLRESRRKAEERTQPVKGHPPTGAATPEAEAKIPASPAPSSNGADQPVRMNLNVATAAQLQRLPGIGPVLSQRIIEYRDANGPFAQVDHLDRVSGIGPKTLAKLKPLLFVPSP